MKPGDKLKVKMGLESDGLYGENYYRGDMFEGGEVVTLKEYNKEHGWVTEECNVYHYTAEMLEPLNKNYLHEAVKSFMADNEIEINEEFKIKESLMENSYMFVFDEEYVLKYNYARETTFYTSDRLFLLLAGELELIKILWKPTGEYFYNTMSGVFVNDMNNQYSINYFNMQHKNYYKTNAEAEADRPRMLKIFDEIQNDFNKI